MSTFLAVGAVSAVLRNLIETSVNHHNLATILGGIVDVSALPPDRIPTGQGTRDRINLFLFQATENPAWRNLDFPSRNGHGDRLANPKLALDLHYLVTAFSAADFHAEALLGHAMFVFHETPVVTRQAIRDTLSTLTPGPLADALSASRLADQFEQIKIVPRVLSVEEVSKIWTALQSQYRTTAAYHVSVVLVEAQQPARSPLPVLTRGRPVPAIGRDEGVFVQAGLLPPVPTLEALALPGGAPAIRLGETLSFLGHHLAGNQPRTRFRLLRGNAVLELPAAPNASDARFDVQMPPDPLAAPVPPTSPLNPANWEAGIYEVTALSVQGGVLRETNRLPLVLAPRIDAINPIVVGGQLSSLDVTFTPPVGLHQSAVLLVGERELRPNPFATATKTLRFPVPAPPHALPAGPQWVRLRIDGIESLVVDYQATPPQFQPSQSVVIP